VDTNTPFEARGVHEPGQLPLMQDERSWRCGGRKEDKKHKGGRSRTCPTNPPVPP